MPRKKTHDEFVAELAYKYPDIICIGRYIHAHAKIEFEHRTCGHRWMATPRNIRGGCSCPKCYGKPKKTNESFLSEFTRVRPDVEPLEKYTTSQKKIKFRHKLCGHEWYARPSSVLHRSGCPRCAGNIKKPHETFIFELEQLNPDIVCLGTYVNSITKLTVKHSCGFVWESTPADILSGYGCPKCGGSMRKTHNGFVDELALKFSDIICLGTYVNINTKILFKHLCGTEWMSSPKNILHGYGCPKCGGSMKKTTSEFVSELAIKNPDIKCLGEYINAKTKTQFQHSCGFIWSAIPNSVFNMAGCPMCYEKRGEKSVRNWLTAHNIVFDPQKTFDNCVYERKLSFDFFIPDLNLCIEYQGKQHYFPIEFFGGADEFKKRVIRDKIKREFCATTGIGLLEIKYNEDVITRLEETIPALVEYQRGS